ncbi:MAG: tagaturonate epimerase family protein [Phascolarctobacterium sp.]|nr:tagaturonate epimerase family protein [Phascolarctobacterium sp.]
MALKQTVARTVMEKAAGNVLEKSLSEIPGGWLALVDTPEGKRLVCICDASSPLAKMWKVEKTVDADGMQVNIMSLNSNNAAVVRRFVKWTAPTACGSKGITLGFSDWLGSAAAFAAVPFAGHGVKPVLVEYTVRDSEALQRNFLEVVDTATWGVLEAGYKEGYGAIAAFLHTEEEIVKALLYGYSMIGIDCSEKINLGIEKLSDEEIAGRYNEFNEEFRQALEASYLDKEFKAGSSTLSFKAEELRRIVLEYGEAIMHIQFLYNSYLKNTPWEINFELAMVKQDKPLSPQEHYLIANELQRNGVKVSTMFLGDWQDMKGQDLQPHCGVADEFGYRLSFGNAELAMEEAEEAVKYLQGNAHFKMSSVLWLTALRLMALKDRALFEKAAAAADLAPAPAEKLIPETETGKAYAASYGTILNPQKGDLAAEIREFLEKNKAEYMQKIQENIEDFIKKLAKN